MRKTIIFITVLCCSVLLAVYIDGRYFFTKAKLTVDESELYAGELDQSPNQQAEEEVQNSPPSLKKNTKPLDDNSDDDLIQEGTQHIEYVCQVKKEAIEYQKIGSIYKWIDASGKVNYSDQAPVNKDVEIVNSGSQSKVFFDIDVSYPAGYVPSNIGEVIRKRGKGVYRVYEQLVDTSLLSKSSIDVRVYKDQNAYQVYKNEMAPSLGATDGFYSPRNNQAVVLHRNNASRTERVSVHETTHVINHHNFGRMPKWFNEGVSEVFENISVSGYSMTLNLNKDWENRLGSQYSLMPLRQLLLSNHQDWTGNQSTLYYANAWGFAHFMLQTSNRKYMKRFIAEMMKDKCTLPDSIAFFENNYPGGIDELASNWQQWVRSDRKLPITL